MFNFLRITNRKENYGSVLAFHSSQWHHLWSLRGGRERRRSMRRTGGNPRVHAFSAARSVPFATEMEARLAFSQLPHNADKTEPAIAAGHLCCQSNHCLSQQLSHPQRPPLQTQHHPSSRIGTEISLLCPDLSWTKIS